MRKTIIFAITLLVLAAIPSGCVINSVITERNQAEHNLLEAEKENKNLIFRESQLKKYLEESETREADLIRKLAEQEEISLRKIKEARTEHIVYVDRFIPQEVIKYDTIYVDSTGAHIRPFTLTRDCYQISGYLAFDSDIAELGLDSVSYSLDVITIKYKKRKWYNPRTWFKPDVADVSASSCGSLNYTKIETTK